MSIWSPNVREAELIITWFEDLDDTGLNQVGGAKIVKFLMTSGLDKGVLRTIWELADQQKRGYVTLEQFTLIIRLVSLAASPRFEGQVPSMEIYAETITDRIPLPHSLVEACDATRELNKELNMEKNNSVESQNSADRRGSKGESPGRRNSDDKITPTRRRSSGSEKASPARRRSSGNKGKQSQELEWLPSLSEEQKINQWFEGLDVDPKDGQVGGAKIVKFLMESGLEKGVLRGVWELVDVDKRGWVNKMQFMLIMRLVSIAYSGQEPTMERYRATITNSYSYPLPPLSLSVVSPVPVPAPAPAPAPALAPAPGGEAVTPGFSPLVASTGTTSAATTPMDTLMGSISPLPGGGGDYNVQWIPSPHEAATLDGWYADLDEKKIHQVGGAKIVGFLMKSGLPKEALRSIWAIGDVGAKGWVSRAEFAVIIRLVAICMYRGGEPSMDGYAAFAADTSLPLPPLGEMSSALTSDGNISTSAAGGCTEWRPNPEEEAIIHRWFSSLAGGSDTIAGATIVPFLMKSGVPKEVLREVWELGDTERKGYVTLAQFTVMVRLVALSLASLQQGESGMPSMRAYYASTGNASLSLPPLDDLPVPQIQTQIQPQVQPQVQDEDEDFSDFSSAPSEALPAVSSAGDLTSSLTAVFGAVQDNHSMTAMNGDDGDDAFGSFDVAVGATTGESMAPTTKDENVDDFGDFGAATTSPEPMTDAMVPRGELAVGGLGLASNLGLSVATAQTDDFGDFSGTSAPDTQEPSSTVTPVEADAWGALDALADNSLPDAVPPPPVPTFAPASPVSAPPRFSHGADIPPANFTGTSSNAAVRPSLSQQGLLSVSELDVISSKLLNCHMYELAYMAARQQEGLFLLDTVADQKAAAVLNDDLERAVLCKRKSSTIIGNLYTQGMEKLWRQVTERGSKGPSLADSIEVVMDIDPEAGMLYRQAFLQRAPSSASLLEKAKFDAAAMRTLRLTLALHTTHQGIEAVWRNIMNHVSMKLRECKVVHMAKYQTLTNIDKVAVKESEKMSCYIRAIVLIAELGLYVATTVMECSHAGSHTKVDIDTAYNIESLAHELLLSIREHWDVSSRLLGQSDSLAVKTGMIMPEGGGGGGESDPVELLKSEAVACPPYPSSTFDNHLQSTDDDGGALEVIYCNLTLRPLACRGKDGKLRNLGASTRGGGGESRVEITTVEVPGVGTAYYLRSAVDFYLNEVSDAIPSITGLFSVETEYIDDGVYS